MAGNQHTPDPRQALFLQYYLDPNSDTFSNALQSGIRAGYSEEYSKTILSKDLDWLSESVNDQSKLRNAEKKLDEILAIPSIDQEGKYDNGLISNQIKVATIYAKGLGKAKYSERSEVETKTSLVISFDESFKE